MGYNRTKRIQQKKDKNSEQNFGVVKLPLLPNFGPTLRREFRKLNIITSNKILKTLLCQNKSNLRLSSYPGVYNVTCSYDAVYYGESKKKM